MIIRKKNKKTANNKRDLELGNLRGTVVKSVSLWKILAVFIIINLVFINMINYWQPINHNEIKTTYDKQQRAMLSAYELQYFFNEFKVDPDKNAFNLIQKTVKLNAEVNNIKKNVKDLNIDTANKLNSNIEKIVASIPSIKLLQQNIDKLYRSTKNIKYKIITNIDNKNNIAYNLYATTDKIEDLLQSLKFDHWTSIGIITNFQKKIEEIGLEIEQYNSFDNPGQLSNAYRGIIIDMEESFNDMNSLMPSILNLSEISISLVEAEQFQNEIIHDINNLKIDYINNIDDKTIIIITILLTNLLLFLIVTASRILDKTRLFYSKYKGKKEVYFLSHVKEDEQKELANNTVKENQYNSVISESIEANKYKEYNEQAITNIIKVKENIIKNCYMLFDNIDKFEKQHTIEINNSDLTDTESVASMPLHQLKVLNKVTQEIMDNVILLDRNLNKISNSNSSMTDRKKPTEVESDTNINTDTSVNDFARSSIVKSTEDYLAEIVKA